MSCNSNGDNHYINEDHNKLFAFEKFCFISGNFLKIFYKEVITFHVRSTIFMTIYQELMEKVY